MRSFITLVFAVFIAFHASAVQTIKVGIVGDADNHQVSWTTERGLNYLVEVSPDLVDWMDTGIVAPGTGEIVTYGFSTPTEPKLFYRIRVRPGAVRPGFDAYELVRQDDRPSEYTDIGFSINLFGETFDSCYVNNNGNITFNSSLRDFTPVPLRALGFPIVAPFWADVDTSAPKSSVVKYSHDIESVNGREAFGVNWVNVGYYEYRDDKLNSFQMVFIERSDTGTGNFDIEFNYDMILWETGDSSGGSNGYGGDPSRSGLSSGSNQSIELSHSGESIVQLDSNPTTGVPNFTTGLIHRARNSAVPGRFVFQVRSGQVLGALNVDAGPDQSLDPEATSAVLAGSASDPSGGAVNILWSIVEGPAGASISNPTALNPTVTFPPYEYIILQLTVTSVSDPAITASDRITINP